MNAGVFMPLQLSRIHAICFDVDGTISDTDDVYVQKMERILHPFRVFFPHQDVHRAARRLVMWLEAPGNFLMGFSDTLGIDDEIAAVMEWLNRHWPRPMKQFLLVSGVKEMLQSLSRVYPLAIVSGRDAESTRSFLDKFELSPLFQIVVTAQTTEHTKPYPDPIIYAARAMNVSPEACLMVGDTIVDIRAGRIAGAQTVGVSCGFGEQDELRRQGADLILPSTAELARLLVK
jgi:HAD superfamily hydrolase (TIGR01549 family)